MLAETATTEISEKRQPRNLPENRQVAHEGGTIAGHARKEIESKTGKRVVSKHKFIAINDEKLLENK